MRVLFATQLLAALAYAGGAPAPSGNTAKRHKDPHLAPHRYDEEKQLIGSGEEGNPGDMTMRLQVILKADDDNRKQQELHTVLILEGEGLEDGMTINMGWAMNIASADEIPMGESEFVLLDDQGSSRQQLIERIATYQGDPGWDGVNLQTTYEGTDSPVWDPAEIWMTTVPDVVTGGIESLTVDSQNSFTVFDQYAVVECTGSKCLASVGTQRVWDTQTGGANGHLIESGEGKERAFQFVGWYQLYGADCATEKPAESTTPAEETTPEEPAEEPVEAEAEPEEGVRRLSTIVNTGNACWIKGQTTTPQVFILGALSGVAAASFAILSSMLF